MYSLYVLCMYVCVLLFCIIFFKLSLYMCGFASSCPCMLVHICHCVSMFFLSPCTLYMYVQCIRACVTYVCICVYTSLVLLYSAPSQRACLSDSSPGRNLCCCLVRCTLYCGHVKLGCTLSTQLPLLLLLLLHMKETSVVPPSARHVNVSLH